MRRHVAQFSAFLALLILPSFAFGTAKDPKGLIDETLQTLVGIVEKYPGKKNTEKRRAEIYDAISPHFDFNEMSKRSLGSHWKGANKDQKAAFVTAFSALLSKTYIEKIELVRRNMVAVDTLREFPPTSSGVERALVKTEVTHKGEEFPIEYKLYNKGKGWKVYDVIVENIGLVSNYRTEFAGIVRKKGIDGLIADLQSK